jgi:lipoate-protein ligase A
MQVRLLPPADWDGPTNMAADEVLLESAIAGTASLRFYTWKVPTVSLGYFQAARVREMQAGMDALPFVRRASGGATLVHHHELTYAIALPAGATWQPRGPSWVCRMHEIVAAALGNLDIPSRLVGCGEEKKLNNVICFLHQTAGDLLVSGHKVAGSAQRKSRGALLQHGGILLRTSRHTPMLPGICELANVDLAPDTLRHALQEAFTSHTGSRLQAYDWTHAETVRTRELAEDKYAGQAWNFKR